VLLSSLALMSSKHYCLLGALQPASQSDIKAVIAIGQGHLASASRDASVNLWRRAKAGSEEADGYFQLQASFLGHSEYVNSLTHIPGESTLGTLASGGNSSLILIHNLETLSPDADECLIGHTSNVCALNYSQTQQRLVSGSWDCTARVWAQSTSGWACELSLEGHEQAVWDVQVFEQGSRVGCYLTGEWRQVKRALTSGSGMRAMEAIANG
jgi:phospholipase A-2-activating protein